MAEWIAACATDDTPNGRAQARTADAIGSGATAYPTRNPARP